MRVYLGIGKSWRVSWSALVVVAIGLFSVLNSARAASTLECTQTGYVLDCSYDVDGDDQAALTGYPTDDQLYWGYGWAACEPDPDSCGGMSSGGGIENFAQGVMSGTFSHNVTAICADHDGEFVYAWLRDGYSGSPLASGDKFVLVDCDPPAPTGWVVADPMNETDKAALFVYVSSWAVFGAAALWTFKKK